MGFELREAILEVVDTISLQASVKNIKLNAAIPTRKLQLTSDKQRIVQVIICLVQNAIKFSSEGPISIKAWVNEKPGEHTEPGFGELYVSVEDRGIGIEPDEMPHLFTEYGILQSGLALNPNGVGLSLSMCKQICQKLNGDISCTSVKNKGSVFTFHVQARIQPIAITSLSNTSITMTNFNLHHLVSEENKPTAYMPSVTNEVSFLFEKMCQVMLSDPKLLNGTLLRERIERAATFEMLDTRMFGDDLNF